MWPPPSRQGFLEGRHTPRLLEDHPGFWLAAKIIVKQCWHFMKPHKSKLLFWKYSFQFRPLLLLTFSSVTLVGTFGFHYHHHRSCSISVKPPATFSSLFQAASPPGQVRRWDPRHWHPFQIFCLERERGRQGWYYHHQHHKISQSTINKWQQFYNHWPSILRNIVFHPEISFKLIILCLNHSFDC